MQHWVGIVLAAGDGSRMKSRIPKPLHRVGGKELIRYPVELLRGLDVEQVIVVASPGNRSVIESLLGDSVEYAVQPRPLGTADALACAMPLLDRGCAHVLLQNADAPLVQPESLQTLADCHLKQGNGMTFLTADGLFTEDLGRVQRDKNGKVAGIVEASEFTGDPYLPAEVNAGVYCFQAGWLAEKLEVLKASPARGERYLTDLAALGSREAGVQGVPALDPAEAFGVNNRVQLALAESVQRDRILQKLMLGGVTIPDPASVYVDVGVVVGLDSTILPNTMLQGSTVIGEDCVIGPNSVIQDSAIGDGCRITASMLEGATVESGVDVGPFSHLRPGAHLEPGVHVGNFVEVKNSRLAAGTMSGHFSYLGDATVGAGVNIGAGTITCNYDGQDKLETIIGDGAFIGCDTMLVAPVTVGANAATGAGAVVTRDVPQGRLAVGVPARMLPKKGNSSTG